MSCKTLRVVHTAPCLSCVVMTLKEHTDAAYKTYIQFLRVIKYSLRTRHMFVKGIKYSLGNIYISTRTTVGNQGVAIFPERDSGAATWW